MKKLILFFLFLMSITITFAQRNIGRESKVTLDDNIDIPVIIDSAGKKVGRLISAIEMKRYSTVNVNSKVDSNLVSEYSVTINGGTSQLTARVKATSGVTISKTNASTLTFTVPAKGKLESYEIYYGTNELPGSNATHIINYTSNTVTNQGLSTSNTPSIKAWYNDVLPVNVFHARSIGSAYDFVSQIIAVGNGNITLLMDWNSGSTGLGMTPFVVKSNF